MRTIDAVALTLLLGTWSLRAFAQDESVVATARQLGEEGLSAYDAGRYDEAAQKLLRAYQAVRVPTFARNAARALAKQGKLVAASELYLEAKRLEPNELWHGQMQQQALRDCEQERQELLPRVARLTILLDVVSAHDTKVFVDGVAIPESLLGTEQFTDPGRRHVVAKRGSDVTERDVELKEGERQHVTLWFGAATGGAQATTEHPNVASTVVQVPPQHPAPQSTANAAKESRAASWLTPAGYVVGGVGVFGLGLGTYFVIRSANTRAKRDSAEACASDANGCTNTDFAIINQYNTVSLHDNRIALVSLLGGGALVVTGLVAILTAPTNSTIAQTLNLRPWAGLQSSGICVDGRW